jgi:hypothetical protein
MTGLGFLSKSLPGSRRRKGPSVRKPTRSRLELEPLEGRALLSANVLQTNLVSDLPGVAELQDPHLVNPWGLTESGSGPFWVSDNNAGVSTLYNAPAKPAAGQPPFGINPLVVSIPTPGDPHPRRPARRHRRPRRDRVQHRRGSDGGIHGQWG